MKKHKVLNNITEIKKKDFAELKHLSDDKEKQIINNIQTQKFNGKIFC